MLTPTALQKPAANRYGLAIAIALLVHSLIVLIFCVQLRSASQDSATSSQIQATLINDTDHNQPVPAPPTPPAPKKSSPPVIAAVVKTKPLPLDQAIDGKIEQPIVTTNKSKPLDSIDKKPAPPVRLNKIKQQSMDKALQQELQKENSQLHQKMLTESLSSEISAESTTASKSANKTLATQATQATANSAEVNRYKAMILQQIQQNWIVPLDVTNLSCELQVELAPGGAVLRVSLLHSSGNDALDRSAIAAVNKASPLPVPRNTADFDAFRNFTLTVKPAAS